MSISIRLNESEVAAIKDYAGAYGMTVSECIRKAILEKIEDEYDLKAYEKAMEEYRQNPITYTHEQVKKELGIE